VSAKAAETGPDGTQEPGERAAVDDESAADPTGPAAEPDADATTRLLRPTRPPDADEADEADGSPLYHPLLEPPDPTPGRASLTVERSFAFVDICGFTGYCERYGEHLALELLIEFRQITRAVVARRGVRVSKWLGDGVMIVSLEPAMLAAACAEIRLRCALGGVDTHAGIATGSVLLLEGDDYVGRTVNLAARLCDSADLGHILAAGELPGLPPWLEISESRLVLLAGMGEPVQAHVLAVTDDIAAAFESTPDVA
jgi:class 3 adenylate cyclase